MKSCISCFTLAIGGFLIALIPLNAQETANRYFESVSENYKNIGYYTANLSITRRETVQTAYVQYKQPNLLRLDFSNPEGMVIAVNDEFLQVWVPEYNVTFEQKLRRDNQSQIPSLATSRGLELMQRYYTVAYADSPSPVPLGENSLEKVIKLHLEWKSNNEGFRKIELSIIPDYKTIRRVIGTTITGETITFDFTDIKLNNSIPITRFDFESPPTGNTIENPFFNPEE